MNSCPALTPCTATARDTAYPSASAHQQGNRGLRSCRGSTQWSCCREQLSSLAGFAWRNLRMSTWSRQQGPSLLAAGARAVAPEPGRLLMPPHLPAVCGNRQTAGMRTAGGVELRLARVWQTVSDQILLVTWQLHLYVLVQLPHLLFAPCYPVLQLPELPYY